MNSLFQYYLWVPVTVVLFALAGYLSYKNNTDNSRIWFYLNWGIALLPIWSIVSKYSKHIFFDGIVYDVAMFLSYNVVLLFLTKDHQSFGWANWLGLFFCFGGLFMLKLK